MSINNLTGIKLKLLNMDYYQTNVVLCILLLFIPASISEEIPGIDCETHHLVPGKDILLSSSQHSKLNVFCYKGEAKYVTTLLKTVEVILDIPNDDFRYYEGFNTTDVYAKYKDASWFSFSPWRPRTFRLGIYNASCIGISSQNPYKISLRVRHVDLWRVICLVTGIGTFISAPVLAHNVVFHYTTGIGMGICGSLLILIFILARSIPKKTGAASILIGGWGLVLYVLQYLWQNCITILKDYQNIAIGYVVIAGLISFAVVYRYGPITDVRSLKLVQWSLQIFSILIIFFSSQFQEATLSIILILLCYQNIPEIAFRKLRILWHRRFPPKIKLLDEDEYHLQAKVETEKALKELRAYCRSPDCNAWKTVSRISSPQRFAEFIEGGSHLSDDELMSYQARFEEALISEDEDSDS